MSITDALIAFGIVCAIAVLFCGSVVFAMFALPGGVSPEKKKRAKEKKKEKEKLVAVVKCKGKDSALRYTYDDAADCNIASVLSNGPTKCAYGCLGLGSCANVCPEGAISIENSVAAVNKEKCNGCGKCVTACSRGIIALVPADCEHTVLCSSELRGSELRRNCEDGCIGCMLCVKTCKCDAVTVSENLASIDYEKCNGCGECAKVCARGIISAPKCAEPEKTEEELSDEKYLRAVIEEAESMEDIDED